MRASTPKYRTEALQGLAELRDTSPATASAAGDDSKPGRRTSRVSAPIYDLVRLLTGRAPSELQPVRNQLVEMATTSGYPVVRQIGYVALMSADNGIEPAWTLATSSVPNLRDFLNALPLVPDPSFRTALYLRVKALLNEMPEGLQTTAKGNGAFGRYVRIELPGERRTLTLAEVEAFAGEENIAPQGRASQINVASGGVPERGIDGITSGLYGLNGQTHTQGEHQGPVVGTRSGRRAGVRPDRGLESP